MARDRATRGKAVISQGIAVLDRTRNRGELRSRRGLVRGAECMKRADGNAREVLIIYARVGGILTVGARQVLAL
jgi:hypothetical protein